MVHGKHQPFEAECLPLPEGGSRWKPRRRTMSVLSGNPGRMSDLLSQEKLDLLILARSTSSILPEYRL